MYRWRAIWGGDPPGAPLVPRLLPALLLVGVGAISATLARDLTFEDRVPHAVDAVRARTLLRPTALGYEETLEVDHGDGEFKPYSVIELRRTP